MSKLRRPTLALAIVASLSLAACDRPAEPSAGTATPADAALMRLLGAEAVFVGSGIFKSGNPAERAEAIVKATTFYDDPDVIAGQGTIAKEVLGDWPEVDCLVAPIGAYAKSDRDGTQISSIRLHDSTQCFGMPSTSSIVKPTRTLPVTRRKTSPWP